jgi:hypothetical protein
MIDPAALVAALDRHSLVIAGRIAEQTALPGGKPYVPEAAIAAGGSVVLTRIEVRRLGTVGGHGSGLNLFP